MALNIANSVVDFLKSRGLKPASGEKFPLFDTRSQLYGQSGLNLGEFRGSGEQNTALLNYLSQAEKKVGVPINPENIFSILSASKANAVQAPTPTSTSTPGGTEPNSEPTPTEIPSYLSGLAKTAAGGTLPSADDLAKTAIEQFTGSTDFQFAQEAAGASKEALQLKSQRDTQDFITKIASRGLFFSGQTKEGISAIEVDKMSSLLGVDRDFAKIIAEGLQKSSQELVKQAKKGQEDAVSALDKLGFILTDGQLVQKPSEARAEEATARATRAEERATTSQELSLLSAERAARGEERALGAEQRAISAEERARARFEKEMGEGTFTKTEKQALEYDETKRTTTTELFKNMGADGFADPDIFRKNRQQVMDTLPSYIDDFDKAFGSLLNPADAVKLGINQVDVDPFEAAKRRAVPR